MTVNNRIGFCNTDFVHERTRLDTIPLFKKVMNVQLWI